MSNGIPQTRRSFLKSTTLAAISTTLPGQAEAAQSRPGITSPPINPVSRVEAINLLQGTDSTPYFSRGNTLPIAALPFGMAHWTLQSNAGTPWMFQPGERRIQGFRSTHQLSPWLSDYGQAVFLPFSGEVSTDPGARAASYRVQDAQLSPHSLRLRLIRYRADVELIPTERCALLETHFGDVPARGLLLEVPASAVAMNVNPATRTIRFASSVNEGGVPPGFATYYVVKFEEPWTKVESKSEGARTTALVHFPSSQSPLRAMIATSFISFKQAEYNLEHEIGSSPTAELRGRAASAWNDHLNRIVIEGGTPSEQRIFDSCFYRTLLFPRTWHEPDAQGRPHHMSPYTGKLMAGVMYADHGYWDVYRAWYPFMTLFFPDRLGEILQAWVNAYHEGGWLPQFPAPGYRACMTGSLIDAVFGDAAVKGVSGFDLPAAYEGLKKHATIPGNPDAGYGRRGIEYYLKLGYVPADRLDQSMAETVDAAYGDFCIAQVANALGKHEDADMFLKRSANWRNLLNEQAKFLRGKNEDGSWVAPFDPVTWGGPYVEGSAWQHRFDVPQDIPGLMQAYGGSAALAALLEQMLTMSVDFNIGTYGREIHEMSEMAAVPFGQYAQSNQPVHHVLYLFAAAGRPDRLQYWVRKVMAELYTESTFPGDEDTGSMAAWFLLSSMGFYPVCPGKAEYTLGSPLFTRITWNVPGRKTTEISAPANSPEHVYVDAVQLNGSRHRETTISHTALTAGARLQFTMSNTPGSQV